MNSHRRIEERSLRLHRAVADKLLCHPEVLVRARQRVGGWLADGSVHPRYAEAWHHVLSMRPEDIADRLVDPDEEMCALRQCSPFAGVLDPRERWRILREDRASDA